MASFAPAYVFPKLNYTVYVTDIGQCAAACVIMMLSLPRVICRHVLVILYLHKPAYCLFEWGFLNVGLPNDKVTIDTIYVIFTSQFFIFVYQSSANLDDYK